MQYFDEYGYLTGEIPQECVESCSHAGRCDDDVEYWQSKLEFEVSSEKAVKYLQEFGAWTKKELSELSQTELAQKVLWVICNEIKEQGESIGMIH